MLILLIFFALSLIWALEHQRLGWMNERKKANKTFFIVKFMFTHIHARSYFSSSHCVNLLLASSLEFFLCFYLLFAWNHFFILILFNLASSLSFNIYNAIYIQSIENLINYSHTLAWQWERESLDVDVHLMLYCRWLWQTTSSRNFYSAHFSHFYCCMATTTTTVFFLPYSFQNEITTSTLLQTLSHF